jgi:hypothetical protein
VHPIERLRYVARASGADQRVLVHETAAALRGLRLEPAGLVTACRRIVERHPTSGPLWWLCARVLTAADPVEEIGRVAREVDDDPTVRILVDELPEEATVLVLGWPDLVGDAVVRRGDLIVLVADVAGEGHGFLRQLARADMDAVDVPAAGLGAAAAAADLVLLEAAAVGPDGIVAVQGSLAAAAVAYCSQIPVWAVAGRGRRLPGELWAALAGRLTDSADPWDAGHEVVPLGLVTHVVGPDGRCAADAEGVRPECAVAPELLKTTAF